MSLNKKNKGMSVDVIFDPKTLLPVSVTSKYKTGFRIHLKGAA